MGLYADSIIKNAFKTAWKVPSRLSIHERLIKYALLSNTPLVLKSLVAQTQKHLLQQSLFHHLTSQPNVVQFDTPKQWANWFYYIHRGVRWSHSTTADLSFFTYPVFLLSDLQAQLLGITSSAWSNFHKDRTRSLNHRLLPEVLTPYDDGEPAVLKSGPSRGFDKIRYEYFERLLAWRRVRREFAAKATKTSNLLEDIPDSRTTCFSEYFAGNLDDILSMNVSYSEKRSAITLYYVMDYLQNA